MMRIVKVEWRRLELELNEPYTIAYETVARVSNILIRIQTACGLVGLGCAAPDEAVTGERADDVMTALADQVEPVLMGANPLRRAWVGEQLEQVFVGRPSLQAAVGMALHDLLAKRARLPLFELLGGYRESMATSITLPILPLVETVARASDYVQQGFVALKMKGGIDVDLDAERVLAVRRAVGPQIEIRFDANQGYSVADTRRFVALSEGMGQIEVLEQPINRDLHVELGELTQSLPVPVMADESAVSSIDAFRLAKDGLVDVLNIKLMKVGGLAEAMRVNAIARVAGMTAMVGCMDECALSISAGLHLALALPNVRYADLDGHLDIVDDPTASAIRLDRGVLYPSARWGLGLDDWD